MPPEGRLWPSSTKKSKDVIAQYIVSFYFYFLEYLGVEVYDLPKQKTHTNDREHLVVNVQLTYYWGNGGMKFWDDGVQGRGQWEG